MKTLTGPPQTTWLLIIHQLPAQPAYLRVKLGRKLQAAGAVPIKNAVHALPLSETALVIFSALAKEVIQGGGEAFVCEAKLLHGLSDVDARALFDAARDADYEELVTEARDRLSSEQVTPADVKRLRQRRDEILAIDFFGAHGAQAANSVLEKLERLLTRHPNVSRTSTPPEFKLEDLKKRVWVTRKHIHVDRIASAWLIRRFIDSHAAFKFVDGKTYKPRSRELRFDMANAEFTHEGSDCTFETLVRRAALRNNRALCALAEVIHDLDVEEEKFGRPEAAGLGALISGICASTKSDQERLVQGSNALDQFYAHFSKA